MDGEEEEVGERPASKPISFLAAAAWTIAVGLISALVVQITESARPGAALDLVNITACFVLAYSLLIFGMLRVYAPDASVRDVLAVRGVSPFAALLSIGSGVALYPGLALVDDFLTKRFPPPQEESELVDKLMHMTSLGERIVLVASLVVVIPLCEELFFRGALFGGLRRGRAEGLAVLASAAFYAMSRGDARSLPSAFVLGLLAAWLRGRSGALALAFLAHAAFNAVPLVPIAMGKGDVDFGSRVAVGGVVVAALCAWLAGLILRRDARAERGRMLDA